MNRKKNIIKLISLFTVSVGVMGFIPLGAINLTLNLGNNQEYIDYLNPEKRIRPIHFKEFQNDFGGLFYFKGLDSIFYTGSVEDEPERDYEYKINGNGSSISCNNQVKGFYYNAERGERLRPIDEETMGDWEFESQGLEMEGGIYTNCTPSADDYKIAKQCCSAPESEGCESYELYTNMDTESCFKQVEEDFADPYSYYGGVTHEYSGQKFILAVGIKYETGTTWIEPQSDIGKTFQRHPEEGILPFGLIYDNLGGVGFAGCEIVENASPVTVLNDIIGELKNSNWGSGIYSLFGVSTGSSDDGKNFLVYNKDQSRKFIDCKDVGQDNGSALKILVEGLIGMRDNEIEYYKEIDQTRPLQKTQYFASININNATLINHARQRAETLCRGKWTENPTISTGINCIDKKPVVLTENDRNKTIIVRNGDVTIKPFSNNTNDYYDIFIDSGSLKIDEDAYTDRFVIKTNGFVNNEVDKEIFKETVDEIQVTTTPSEDMWSGLNNIGVASILKGNFIVNGSISSKNGTGLNNKYFVYGKLTSLDGHQKLSDTFSWKCNYGSGSDGYPCPGPKVGGKSNQYQDAPLVIIDQNYDSPLFK